MSVIVRVGLAVAVVMGMSVQVQAAPRPIEQLYAECHKKVVTPRGKLKDGDPRTDAAIEQCIKKRLPPPPKAKTT